MTMGMSIAWIRSVRRIQGGKFYTMRPWHYYGKASYGTWDGRDL